MPELSIVRVNGVPYSWNSTAHFFNGLPYKGLTGVDFEDGREVKIVHAAQQDGVPVGITAGQYEVGDVVFKFLRESGNALLQDLSVFGLGSFGDASFVYTMQVYEPVLQVPPALPSITTISGCRITKVRETQELGVDELITEITCKAVQLRRVVGGTPLQLWSAIRTLLP